jgi:hypothetical protein
MAEEEARPATFSRSSCLVATYAVFDREGEFGRGRL